MAVFGHLLFEHGLERHGGQPEIRRAEPAVFEDVLDQPVQPLRPVRDTRQVEAPAVAKPVACVFLDRGRIAADGADGRAQVVRDRGGEGLQLGNARVQSVGSFLDLAFQPCVLLPEMPVVAAAHDGQRSERGH